MSNANVEETILSMEKRMQRIYENLKRIEKLTIIIVEMAKRILDQHREECLIIGESEEERNYLRSIAMAWKWGCENSGIEFLAPLILIWAIVKDKLKHYPNLEREARAWIALNRILWGAKLGIDWEFLRIEDKDYVWRYRVHALKRIIEKINPTLVEALSIIGGKNEVPELLYSLTSNKLYKAIRTANGVKAGEEVSVRELDREILKKYEWLEPAYILSVGHLKVEYVIVKGSHTPTNHGFDRAYIVVHNCDKHKAHYGKVYVIIKEFETPNLIAIGKADAGTRDHAIPPASSITVEVPLKHITNNGILADKRHSTWIILEQIG